MGRKAKKTILFYGEGLVGERVFLTHVKKLCLEYHPDYNSKILGITTSSDSGGSPANVLREARKTLNSGSYDRCIILMDTDLPWPDSLTTKLCGVDTIYLGCSPCLEGYLLRLLGKNIPHLSDDCKQAFYGSRNPRGIEVKKAIEAAITWEILQTAYEENNRIIRCILDHYDHTKISDYLAGTIIRE